MNAELHTDLLGKDKRDEIAQAGRKLSALGTALLNSQETKGNLIERYRQNMRAIGFSLGIDFLSEPIESKGMLEDFSNIKGFRIYIGKGFIPLGTELHTSFLDYGIPIYETKYKSYHEYFKTKPLPTAIREYYNNYYNRGEKNR